MNRNFLSKCDKIMINTILLFVALLTVLIVVLFNSVNVVNAETDNNTTLLDGEEVIFEFTSISDIHMKSYDCPEMERFRKAIELSYQNTSSLDAIVINGDYTDGGHDPQYERFLDVLEEKNTNDLPVLVNLGNHENGRNESDSHEFFRKTFDYSIDNVWQLEGYTIISLGVHYGDKYLETQAKWLDSKLKIVTEQDPEKPVFVLTHYPTKNTVPKSNSRNGRDTFEDVLVKYPQVINITGHTHAAIDDPRMIHQEDFTSFNNGSLTYTVLEHYDFNGSEDMVIHGEFAIFKVTSFNRVIIERYAINDEDIKKSQKIGEDYIIDTPKGIDGFTYTQGWYDDGSYPEFASDAMINVFEADNNFMITFSQASGSTLVYYYTVTVKDLETNNVIKVAKYHSHFYELNRPESITKKLYADLLPGTEYQISIIATNVANRSSEPITEVITVN